MAAEGWNRPLELAAGGDGTVDVIELPSYEEALQLRVVSSPNTPVLSTHHETETFSPAINTPSTTATRFSFLSSPEQQAGGEERRGGVSGEREGEGEEGEGLASPAPPSYPESSPVTVTSAVSPFSDRPLTSASTAPERLSTPRATNDNQTESESYCCAGAGGPQISKIIFAAWKIGFKRMATVGKIKSWIRYTIMILQILLLIGTLLYIHYTDTDYQRVKYLRVTALGLALAIILLERFTYWCIHTLKHRGRNDLWNFMSDFIVLSVTEFLIYITLASTIYSTSKVYREEYRYDITDSSTSEGDMRQRNLMLSVVSLLYLLILVVRGYLVVSMTRSLLKARVANVSQAWLSQKVFLYGLCINSIGVSVLQILLAIFTGLLFNEDVLLGVQIVRDSVFLAVSGLVPMLLWWLYFTTTSPWFRYLPVSFLLDLPPSLDVTNTLDMQSVRSHFHNLHGRMASLKGIVINTVRLFTSVLYWVLYGVFLLAVVCLSFFITTYSLIVELVSLPLVAVGTVTLLLLIVLSLPSTLFAVAMLLGCVLSPLAIPVSVIYQCLASPRPRLTHAHGTDL